MLGYAGERDLLLTQKEYLLLLTLMQNGDRLIGKDELYETVWGASPGGDHSALYTAVSRLNKKLDGSFVRVVFHRGEGYALEPE
jgi:DNA-binding response OmpR family regulator